MPSETDRTQQFPTPCPADWLIPYRQALLAELEGLGYTPGTIRHFQDAIDLFREQVAVRGLNPGDIDVLVLAELQDAVPRPRSLNGSRSRRSCLARFTDQLVTAGVIVAPAAEPPPPRGWVEQLGADYGDWLRLQRGLSRSTVSECRRFLKRFLVFLFGAEPGDLNSIGPENVRAFLAQPSAAPGCGQDLNGKAMNLRRMFRFMFATGLTRRDLVPCVPTIAAPEQGWCIVPPFSRGGSQAGLLDTPFKDSDQRQMAIAHFCNGILDRCMAVPVLTLKLRRHAPYQYGRRRPEGTGRSIGVAPKSRQRSGLPASPHRVYSNNRSRAALSGKTIRPMPSRCDLPGALRISDPPIRFVCGFHAIYVT